MLDVARVFGNNVRQLRREVGQRQSQLAQAVGMSVQMISAMENGSMPSMDVAVKVAHYFQVPVSRLIGDLTMGEEEVDVVPTDAIQIRVLQLCKDLALAPVETRNLMADWIIELGAKLHTPATPPDVPPGPAPQETTRPVHQPQPLHGKDADEVCTR